MPRDLPDVGARPVDGPTEQLPLRADLHSTAEREAIQSQSRGDVGEHRLDRPHSSTVVVTTSFGIESLDHLSDGRIAVVHNGDASRLRLRSSNAL